MSTVVWNWLCLTCLTIQSDETKIVRLSINKSSFLEIDSLLVLKLLMCHYLCNTGYIFPLGPLVLDRHNRLFLLHSNNTVKTKRVGLGRGRGSGGGRRRDWGRHENNLVQDGALRLYTVKQTFLLTILFRYINCRKVYCYIFILCFWIYYCWFNEFFSVHHPFLMKTKIFHSLWPQKLVFQSLKIS